MSVHLIRLSKCRQLLAMAQVCLSRLPLYTFENKILIQANRFKSVRKEMSLSKTVANITLYCRSVLDFSDAIDVLCMYLKCNEWW